MITSLPGKRERERLGTRLPVIVPCLTFFHVVVFIYT